jgi:hypothetical protein
MGRAGCSDFRLTLILQPSKIVVMSMPSFPFPHRRQHWPPGLLEKLRDYQRLLLGFEYAWAWPQGEPMDSVMTDVRAEVDRLRQLGWQVSVTGSLTPRPEVVFRLENISEAAA